MGRNNELVATMVQFHPKVREWIEQHARFNVDSMSSVVRRAIREYIEKEDPGGWSAIEAAIKEENQATDAITDGA